MKLIKRRATLLLCSAAVAGFATAASARPIHHHDRHVYRHAARAIAASAMPAQKTVADHDMHYPVNVTEAPTNQLTTDTIGRGRRHSRYARVARDPRLGTEANASFIAAQSHSNSAFGGVTSDALVSESRKYIGTNPTGRGSLWCGAFMDMVLKRTGHAGGGNLASGYAHYGTRVSGPQVGAIAVMGRHGGGHVGVVSGIDANGNPIIVSGNHNHTVAESVYPRGRIAAYVLPGG
jgi:uncharacterized protein (TIGR02594 family)